MAEAETQMRGATAAPLEKLHRDLVDVATRIGARAYSRGLAEGWEQRAHAQAQHDLTTVPDEALRTLRATHPGLARMFECVIAERDQLAEQHKDTRRLLDQLRMATNSLLGTHHPAPAPNEQLVMYGPLHADRHGNLAYLTEAARVALGVPPFPGGSVADAPIEARLDLVEDPEDAPQIASPRARLCHCRRYGRPHSWEPGESCPPERVGPPETSS